MSEEKKAKAREYARRSYERKKVEQGGVGYNVEGYRRGKRSPRTRANRLFNSAKNRRSDVTITSDWIETKIRAGMCEVSGLPFVLTERRSPFSPSLDRKDNLKGYTPENTQVVVWIYNAAKNVFDHGAVLVLAEALCSHKVN